MDPYRRARPPGGVRFTAWFLGINAFFTCLISVILLIATPSSAVLADVGLTRGVWQGMGFGVLVIGLLEFLLIYALWDGSNVARIITTVLAGLGAVGALGSLATAGSLPAGGRPLAFVGPIQLLIDLAILASLWASPSASEFFRREPRVAATPAPPAIPPPPLS